MFKLLDLGLNESAEARSMFAGLCGRKQALSKVDREAILVILRQYKSQALAWIPAMIPVRENVAIVFGTLFQECKADEVLPVAARYITTATDVLRFIAVLSGTDGSLQRETVFQQYERMEGPSRFWGAIAKIIGAKPPGPYPRTVTVPIRVNRFKVAKMSRSLRRSLLNLLERIERERLIEDMLRHRSYWVWVGEFLHPGEMANRFPKTASAFQVVRKNDDSGKAAPPFHTWYSRVENAIAQHDVHRMLTILKERPGEFARRFDFAIRVAGDDAAAINDIVNSLVVLMPALATPVLLTLRNHLSKRHGPAKVRIYWPKGQVLAGVHVPPQDVASLKQPSFQPGQRQFLRFLPQGLPIWLEVQFPVRVLAHGASWFLCRDFRRPVAPGQQPRDQRVPSASDRQTEFQADRAQSFLAQAVEQFLGAKPPGPPQHGPHGRHATAIHALDPQSIDELPQLLARHGPQDPCFER
ncbi:MAG: hypothetical protein ACYC0X_03740 [Pirellulaceae bacterium]